MDEKNMTIGDYAVAEESRNTDAPERDGGGLYINRKDLINRAYRLRFSGMNYLQIANMLNVPRGTVVTWLARKKHNKNKPSRLMRQTFARHHTYPKSLKKQIKRLFQQGSTILELSKEYNIPGGTVWGWCNSKRQAKNIENYERMQGKGVGVDIQPAPVSHPQELLNTQKEFDPSSYRMGFVDGYHEGKKR